MPELSRREFTKGAINSLLTFALLETFSKLDIFANSVKPLMNRWLLDVNDLSRELRGKKIAQVVWQKKLEELYSQIELPDLLKLADFDRLTKNIEFYDDRANTVDVHFPNVEGLPDKLEYITRIFALSKGRSIVPHGHRALDDALGLRVRAAQARPRRGGRVSIADRQKDLAPHATAYVRAEHAPGHRRYPQSIPLAGTREPVDH